MPFVRLAIASVVALLGLTAGSASAADTPPQDPTARAEWFSAKAEEAFQGGKFNDAIRLYLDAYEASPSASILYNVAFIYDKRLKDGELAIDYYDRVAKAPDADQALADKARARAAALRDLAKKPPPDGHDKPPDGHDGGHDKPPDGHDGGHDKLPDPVTTDDGGGFPVGPVITMVAGGAVLATGIVFGTMAQSTHDDFAAAETAAQKKDLQSTGRTQALVADLGMAFGGAVLAGGLVWLVIDGLSGPSAASSVEPVPDSTWRVMPAAGPGGVGLVIGGRW